MNYISKICTILFLPFILLLFAAGLSLAVDLDSQADPTDTGSTMYTLEDIYQRLISGTAGNKLDGAFVEPTSGPTAGTGRTLDEVMDTAPPVIADEEGVTAEGVARGKQFWGLTSAGWGLQTGGGPVVMSTGATQTAPVNPAPAGSDGDLRKGIPWPSPRFTCNPNGDCNNGDGTVTDNLTGLVWLRDADCRDTVGGVEKEDGTLPWADALTWSNALADSFCDLSDDSSAGNWRLPNIRELRSLLDYSIYPPNPPSDVFTYLEHVYWTSTISANQTISRWYFNFGNGQQNITVNFTAYNVWPVRDPIP